MIFLFQPLAHDLLVLASSSVVRKSPSATCRSFLSCRNCFRSAAWASVLRYTALMLCMKPPGDRQPILRRQDFLNHVMRLARDREDDEHVFSRQNAFDDPCRRSVL